MRRRMPEDERDPEWDCDEETPYDEMLQFADYTDAQLDDWDGDDDDSGEG